MTQSKREPFAYIKKCGETGACHYLVAVIGDHFEGIMPKDNDRWEESCERINAAFNARVDEEVKKAVEEIEAVWSARLAQSEAFCVSLAEGGEMAKAILEDGFPIVHLRNFVDKEKVKAVEEFRQKVLELIYGHICGPDCGVRGFGDACLFDFPKAIRALPTEPEGK